MARIPSVDELMDDGSDLRDGENCSAYCERRGVAIRKRGDMIREFIATLAHPQDRVFQVSLVEPRTFTKTYETAAWYRNIECQPQEHIITAAWGLGSWYWGYSMSGVVTSAYLGAMFGGVPVGADQSGPREVGKGAEWSASWDEFTLEHSVMSGRDRAEIMDGAMVVERLA